MDPGRVVLGRVAGAHGLRGQIRVRFYGDSPENVLRADEVWLSDTPEGARAQRFEVTERGYGRSGEIRLGLAGVASRDAAAALGGRHLLGSTARLEALPEGEVYWYQVIGCRVEGDDGSEIGTVREILETGAHDVLVVEAPDGRRHLIPAAAALLREVDIGARRIVVEVLPGLLD